MAADRPAGGTRRGELRVEELAPESRPEWEAFVAGSSLGSAYALPGYLDVLSGVVGGGTRIVVARRGDAIGGGLALLEQKAPVGRYVSPRILLYYNGFVLRDYETRYPSERVARQLETVEALAAHVAAFGYGRLALRTRSPFADARPLLAHGWSVTPSYTYVVPLDDLEQLWARVDQNLRRLVERGRGNGLELVVDDDFDAFHRLHVGTGGRKGAPVYLDLDRFRRYYDGLRALGLCHLFHARTPDGRVAASQLVLLGHRVTHTVSAASEPALQATGANPWLRWTVFEQLAAEGFVANDLTDAMLPSVARFKSQLGGELTQTLFCERPLSFAYATQRKAHHALSGARGLLRRPS
jgi:hypothetical protein